MPIYSLDNHQPSIAASAWIANNATVIGRVTLAAQVSLWWQSVIRGDTDWINIGEDSNIQDSSVLHTDMGIELNIGRRVTLGHRVMAHGCTIGDDCLIGIGSVILNRAVIGAESLVGAHSLIPEAKVYPSRSLILGSPAKVVRTLTDSEVEGIRASAKHYVDNANRYRSQLIRIDSVEAN